MSDWDTALDAFEARLLAQSAALSAGGDPTVPPFVPPALAGELPLHLAERARTLLQRCRDIEADLGFALADAGIALQRAIDAPAATAPPRHPVYFDSRI